MHYCFTCPDQARIPGAIERICCYSPFIKPGVVNGRQMMVADAQATWQWLCNTGLPFPPGVSFQCTLTNPAPSQDRTPAVYCVQKTDPVVQPTNVNAPYQTPVGNHGMGEPPREGQPRTVPRGMYETLPDAGLPGNDDPMMGPSDGQGGTFTDIDGNGREEHRTLARPASIPVTQQAHGG